MTNPTLYFNDRAEISELPDEIKQVIQHRGFTASSGSSKVGFCGFVSVDDVSAVFLPRSIKLERSQIELAKASSLLFRAIRKYQSSFSSLAHFEDDGESLVNGKRVSLLYQLLQDYQRNGLYRERRTRLAANSGKINWARTLKRYQPTLSQNGPVYLDYVGDKRHYAYSDEISRIHAHIINEIDSRYALLLLGSSVYREGTSLLPSVRSKEYFLATLGSALRNTYSSRDVWLLRSLLGYVNDEMGESQSNVVMGSPKFHSIWEHMLGEVLPRKLRLNSKFSIPTYRSAAGAACQLPAKGQRTDIIIQGRSDNEYWLADAKYYDASLPKNLPGWGDIVKQLFYSQAIKSYDPAAEVKNFFVFPGRDRHFTEGYMSFKGSKDDRDPNYGNIVCVYIDPLDVMRSYCENQYCDSLISALADAVSDSVDAGSL